MEIGCGSGILLSMLSHRFDTLTFNGIEPFGGSFSSLRELGKIVKLSEILIKNKTYEQFNPTIKFDLIYCVNVFEHVHDWRDFLLKVSKWITQKGKIVILCPNYGFPYESHFRIPILFNKSITYRIFKKFIINFEQKNNQVGVWGSLNFVRKSEILYFLKSQSKLRLIDDLSIMNDIVERVSKDKEFRGRQNIISMIALISKKFGLLGLLKLFPNLMPYMKFEIRNV